ncbi:MAG: hypothetical protein HC848_04875 [Limnobacter sp.]|nr:hypothetical protein [Limnobacter sp.]
MEEIPVAQLMQVLPVLGELRAQNTSGERARKVACFKGWLKQEPAESLRFLLNCIPDKQRMKPGDALQAQLQSTLEQALDSNPALYYNEVLEVLASTKLDKSRVEYLMPKLLAAYAVNPDFRHPVHG